MLNPQITPIYQETFQKDTIYYYLSSLTSFILFLPWIFIYGRQTELMIYEKETTRKALLVMGMRMKIYYSSWLIFYASLYLIVNFATSGIFVSVFKKVPFYMPFLVSLLLQSILMIQSLFIQLFFNKAKFGMIIALIFFTMQFITTILVNKGE